VFILPIDYTDEDLAARWEEFFESSENRVRVAEVADLYPEVRSINIAYAELDQFDPDMAQFMLEEPQRVLSIGETVVHKQVQQTRGNYKIHLRFKALAPDSRVDVRKLRSEHLGKLVAIEGLVRKATDVRPKLVEAVFRLTGFEGEVQWDATKPDGQMYKGFDVTRMREVLGFRPRVSLEEGLALTIEWFARHHETARL